MRMMSGPRSLKSGSSMGYYTDYGLSLLGSEEDQRNFEQDLLEQTKWVNHAGKKQIDPNIQELIETGCVYAKWYRCIEDISAIAVKYPNLLVILEGSGESQDDMWEYRWKGNLHEHQKAVIPPFKTPELLLDSEKV